MGYYNENLENYQTTFGRKDIGELGILMQYIYNRICHIKEVESQLLRIERIINTLVMYMQDLNIGDIPWESYRFPNALRSDPQRILDNRYRDLLMENYFSLKRNPVITLARRKLRNQEIVSPLVKKTYFELFDSIVKYGKLIDSHKNYLAEIVGLSDIDHQIVEQFITTLFNFGIAQGDNAVVADDGFTLNFSNIPTVDPKGSRYEQIEYDPNYFNEFYTDDDSDIN